MATPVTLVDSGGIAVTNAPGGTPMTPVDAYGLAATLVDSGGLPVTLVNEDGTPWVGGGLPANAFAAALDGGEPIVLASMNAFLSASGADYVGAAGTSGYGAYGYSQKRIPAGYDGYVEMDVLDANNYAPMLALDVNAELQTYGNNDYNAYVSASSPFNVQRASNTTTVTNTNVAFAAAAGRKLRWERSGTTMLLRLSEDSGNLWRSIVTFNTGVPAGHLYAHLLSTASKRISAPRGATFVPQTDVNFVADGNSLTDGSYAAGSFIPTGVGWPEMLADLPQMKGATVTNFAVSGQTTAQMASDAATQVDPAVVAGRTNILVCWEIRNHLFQNGNVAGCVEALLAYVDARKTAGYDKVYVCGVLPGDITNFGATPGATTTFGDTAAQFATKLDDANTLLSTEWVGRADGFIDLRSNATLATMTQDTYHDGTHLTAPRSSIVRDMVLTAITGDL